VRVADIGGVRSHLAAVVAAPVFAKIAPLLDDIGRRLAGKLGKFRGRADAIESMALGADLPRLHAVGDEHVRACWPDHRADSDEADNESASPPSGDVQGHLRYSTRSHADTSAQ